MADIPATIARTARESSLLSFVRRVFEDRVYAEAVWAYIFLLPTVALFGTFTVLPVVRTLVISMEQFTGFTQGHDFVGLENYQLVMTTEPLFWRAVLTSAIYTAAVVPAHVLVPLILAGLVTRFTSWLQTFFKVAYYIPQVAAGVTLSLAWLWILYPLRTGLANQLVIALGGQQHRWLADTSTALPSLIVMAAVSGWGEGIILYLAAMGGVPRSLYEAADIDCASPWSKFVNVTVPLIKPTTLFLVVTGTIGSFQVFESAYVLTRGGPENTTTTFVYMIYRLAFEQFDFGRGAAAAVLLAIVIIALAVVQFKWLSTQVEY